jgi:hypothetical protein
LQNVSDLPATICSLHAFDLIHAKANHAAVKKNGVQNWHKTDRKGESNHLHIRIVSGSDHVGDFFAVFDR